MAKLAKNEGVGSAALGKLNNVLMQMRKVCNHPDLITSPFSSDIDYPKPEEARSPHSMPVTCVCSMRLQSHLSLASAAWHVMGLCNIHRYRCSGEIGCGVRWHVLMQWVQHWASSQHTNCTACMFV